MLPHQEIPEVPRPEKGSEGSEEEAEDPKEVEAEESDPEELHVLADESAAEEEMMGVVDVPRRERFPPENAGHQHGCESMCPASIGCTVT